MGQLWWGQVEALINQEIDEERNLLSLPEQLTGVGFPGNPVPTRCVCEVPVLCYELPILCYELPALRGCVTGSQGGRQH